MNIITKVTWESMKKNRTRTAVTVIGVILSAAMFTAITTLLSSAYTAGKNTMIELEGNYHVGVYSESGTEVESLRSDKRCASLVCARVLGFANADTQDEEKPYFYLLQADDTFADTMSVRLIDGRLPTSPDEIALPEHYIESGAERVPVGQTIDLTIGRRLSPNGEVCSYNDDYDSNETWKAEWERVYTVTGYYERPAFESYTAPGYTVLVGGGSQTTEPNAIYDSYALVKYPLFNLERLVEDRLPEAETMVNWDLLAFSGLLQYGDLFSVVLGFGAVFALIIFIGSVTLIYSAFSISVSERTQLYGLLSSVGATAKQLRRSVLTEGLFLCLPGVPLGCLAGVCGIGITLHFCGDVIADLFSWTGSMSLSLEPWTIIVAALVTVLTVLVSAYVPARRASRQTAIEAIRLSRDIKRTRRTKNREFSEKFYRRFGVPAALACKYFSRSRKKYRTTILSLAFSILLFVSTGSFTANLLRSVFGVADVEAADIAISVPLSDASLALEDQLAGTDGVTRFTLSYYADQMDILTNEDTLTQDYLSYLSTRDDGTAPLLIYCPILYINDRYFDSLLPDGADRDAYYNADAPLYLVSNHCNWRERYYDESGEPQLRVYDYRILRSNATTLSVAEEPELEEGLYLDDLVWENGVYRWQLGSIEESGTFHGTDNKIDATIRQIAVGDKIDVELLAGVNTDRCAILLRPMSMLPSAIANGSVQPMPMQSYGSESASDRPMITLSLKIDGDPDDVADRVISLLQQCRIAGYRVSNYAAAEAAERAIITVVRVFAYGFIILISLMAAANVFNTVSTNIALRRRDFAMLRSIGMNARGILKMMNTECLIYGTCSLLLGTPLSLLASFGIYQITRSIGEYSYILPWQYLLVSAVSVFLVVFSSMLYAYSRLRNDETVEVLKNENV